MRSDREFTDSEIEKIAGIIHLPHREFGEYDTPQGLWMSRIGYHCETAGPKLDIEGAMNRVVKMSLVNTLN